MLGTAPYVVVGFIGVVAILWPLISSVARGAPTVMTRRRVTPQVADRTTHTSQPARSNPGH